MTGAVQTRFVIRLIKIPQSYLRVKASQVHMIVYDNTGDVRNYILKLFRLLLGKGSKHSDDGCLCCSPSF